MLDYVNLGGKKRPLLYGNAAFKMLKQRSGVGLPDFLNTLYTGEIDVISDITYCALRVGEMAINTAPDEEYDEMKVAIWIDQFEGGATAFLQKISESLPQPKTGEGEAQGEAKTNQAGAGTN